jgi:hypothetical protein
MVSVLKPKASTQNIISGCWLIISVDFDDQSVGVLAPTSLVSRGRSLNSMSGDMR